MSQDPMECPDCAGYHPGYECRDPRENYQAPRGLYADKCADCTTGLSCEEADACLSEL